MGRKSRIRSQRGHLCPQCGEAMHVAFEQQAQCDTGRVGVAVLECVACDFETVSIAGPNLTSAREVHSALIELVEAGAVVLGA